MYRQLDEATFERFEPFGRVRDDERDLREGVLQLVGRDTTTGALVRYDAYPPNWSREGPSEFVHWVLHHGKFGLLPPYPVAESADGRRMFWTGTADAHCPGIADWHVSQDRPTVMMMGQLTPQWLAKNRGKRCTVDLDELKQAWRAKANAEVAELRQAQAKFNELKTLPLIVLPD